MFRIHVVHPISNKRLFIDKYACEWQPGHGIHATKYAFAYNSASMWENKNTLRLGAHGYLIYHLQSEMSQLLIQSLNVLSHVKFANMKYSRQNVNKLTCRNVLLNVGVSFRGHICYYYWNIIQKCANIILKIQRKLLHSSTWSIRHFSLTAYSWIYRFVAGLQGTKTLCIPFLIWCASEL